MQAPGAHTLCHRSHTSLIPMSDMNFSMTVEIVPGSDVCQDRLLMHMPGMSQDSSLCVCSHVGYKQDRRSVTCPGQCAHPNLGRSDTFESTLPWASFVTVGGTVQSASPR